MTSTPSPPPPPRPSGWQAPVGPPAGESPGRRQRGLPDPSLSWSWVPVVMPPVVVIASFIATIVIVVVLSRFIDKTLAGTLATSLVSLGIVLGGVLVWRTIPSPEREIAVMRPSPVTPTISIGVASGIGLLITMVAVTAAGFVIDPGMRERLADVQIELPGLTAKIAAVISLVILAPVGEELIFRSLMFRGLQRRMSFWWAAVVSSLAFGAAHLDVWVSGAWMRGIAVAVVGVGLCLVYRRWGYWGSVTAHATVNAIAAVSLLSQ